MVTDPDAIWKPGYDGPLPSVGEPVVDPVVTSARPRRSRPRIVAALVLAASVAVAGTVVVAGVLDRDGDPSDGDTFAGADRRRLPLAVDEVWSRSVPATPDESRDRTWVEVIGRDLVVVATGGDGGADGGADGGGEGGGADTTGLTALDASTGDDRWTLRLAAPVDDVSVIAAVDDVVVVGSVVDGGRTIRGLDMDDGREQWTFSTPATVGVEALAGTELVAIVPPEVDAAVTLVDPAAGTTVGAIDGQIIATDGLGRWYAERADPRRVVEYDLRDGFEEPTPVADLTDEFDGPVTVVDGVAVGSSASGFVVSRPDGGAAPIFVATTPGVADLPAAVGAIEPTVGTSFVVVGGGEVIGANLGADAIELQWELTGVLTLSGATDRGALLLVGTRDGAGQELVDAATGRTIAVLDMASGVFDSLLLVGNGVVTRRFSEGEPRLVGLGLDGEELWSLDGSTPVSVGDGIVVRAEPTSGGLTVTAYGERRDG